MKHKTLEEMVQFCHENKEQAQRELYQLQLIGEKDYRMNLIWTYEHKAGLHLVDALHATDNVVAALKQYEKKTIGKNHEMSKM